MLGTDDNPGIMARALDELFRRMDSGNNEHIYDVKMSYLEVLNLFLNLPRSNNEF